MAEQTDSFAVRMIYFRVGWMTRYQGMSGDSISGGGAYVERHGFGHEMYNYRPFRGRLYGYVRPRDEDGTIRLERICFHGTPDELSGVLAVWVARSPAGGSYVVGWYGDATLFRMSQDSPADSGRHIEGEGVRFYVTTRCEDAILLAPDERTFPVPQGSGGMGQSNVWYADKRQHERFRINLLRYVNTRVTPTPRPRASDRTPRQPDPFLRHRVERAAIETVTAHFTGLGYEIDSVERDNQGWDLTAVAGRRELLLEVKGLSGSEIAVELTPNEYSAMTRHRDSYRLCVVTNTSSTPRLSVFAYCSDSGRWEDADGHPLGLREVVSARCSCP